MELKEVFEPIVNFLKNFQKKDKDTISKDKAKERLQLVLMQDRASVSPDFFEMMKKEIIEVIKKYIEIDEEQLEVQITRGLEDCDGTGPALLANIPIKNIKPVAKKVVEKEPVTVDEATTEAKTEEKIDEIKEEIIQEVKDKVESIVKEQTEDATQKIEEKKEEVIEEVVQTAEIIEQKVDDIKAENEEKVETEDANTEEKSSIKKKLDTVKEEVSDKISKVKSQAKDGIKKIKSKVKAKN